MKQQRHLVFSENTRKQIIHYHEAPRTESRTEGAQVKLATTQKAALASICREHNIKFKTRGIDLTDREAAADWIDKNQLGRRNLSPDAFKLLLGRRYNRTKGTIGGQIPGSRVAQNDPPLSTAERLSKEHGVSPATIKRVGHFAEEVEKTPELKKAIDTGRPEWWPGPVGSGRRQAMLPKTHRHQGHLKKRPSTSRNHLKPSIRPGGLP